jgi:hypothetical protein
MLTLTTMAHVTTVNHYKHVITINNGTWPHETTTCKSLYTRNFNYVHTRKNSFFEDFVKVLLFVRVERIYVVILLRSDFSWCWNIWFRNCWSFLLYKFYMKEYFDEQRIVRQYKVVVVIFYDKLWRFLYTWWW